MTDQKDAAWLADQARLCEGSQIQASSLNEPASLTQGGIFSAFMRAVWGDGEADAPDYRIYYDAIRVASAFGAKPTGEGKAGDAGASANGAKWLFPDGTSVWVATDFDGCGVGLAGPHGRIPRHHRA